MRNIFFLLTLIASLAQASTVTYPIKPSLGGSGVANSNSATLTRSGAYPLTLTTTASTNVTLPTSGTLAATTQLNSGNIIRNGNFDLWQRGTSFTMNTANAGQFWMDGFRNGSPSTGVAGVTQNTSVPTVAQSAYASRYSVRLAVATADASISAAERYDFYQTVEGQDYAQIVGRQVTLSFWVKSKIKTGIHCVAFHAIGENGYYVAEYTINSADTWEKKTITLTLNPTGTPVLDNTAALRIMWALAAGSNYQGTASTWGSGNTISATSNQVNGFDSTLNEFYITQVMLNTGSVAQTFARSGISIDSEVQRAQRYYEKSYALDTMPGTATTNGAHNVHSISSAATRVTIPFATRKRAAPTMTYYSRIDGASGNFYDATSGLNRGITATSAGESSASLNVTSTNAYVANSGDILEGHWTADADL